MFQADKLAANKVMFQIYREGDFNRRYRVVYFTELGDHNKETEINRALAGEPVYDGFIKDYRKEEAKAIIARHLDLLNEGQPFDRTAFERDLAAFLPTHPH